MGLACPRNVEAGAGTIQELAGHTTLTVTLRYMHLAPSALRDAISLLSDRSWQKRAQRGGSFCSFPRIIANLSCGVEWTSIEPSASRRQPKSFTFSTWLAF